MFLPGAGITLKKVGSLEKQGRPDVEAKSLLCTGYTFFGEDNENGGAGVEVGYFVGVAGGRKGGGGWCRRDEEEAAEAGGEGYDFHDEC